MRLSWRPRHVLAVGKQDQLALPGFRAVFPGHEPTSESGFVHRVGRAVIGHVVPCGQGHDLRNGMLASRIREGSLLSLSVG